MSSHEIIGAWLSLVERCVRDAEVASSNLVAPIDKTLRNQAFCRVFSCLARRSKRKTSFSFRPWFVVFIWSRQLSDPRSERPSIMRWAATRNKLLSCVLTLPCILPQYCILPRSYMLQAVLPKVVAHQNLGPVGLGELIDSVGSNATRALRTAASSMCSVTSLNAFLTS